MKYMHGIIMKLLRVAHAAVSVFQLNCPRGNRDVTTLHQHHKK